MKVNHAEHRCSFRDVLCVCVCICDYVCGCISYHLLAWWFLASSWEHVRHCVWYGLQKISLNCEVSPMEHANLTWNEWSLARRRKNFFISGKECCVEEKAQNDWDRRVSSIKSLDKVHGRELTKAVLVGLSDRVPTKFSRFFLAMSYYRKLRKCRQVTNFHTTTYVHARLHIVPPQYTRKRIRNHCWHWRKLTKVYSKRSDYLRG